MALKRLRKNNINSSFPLLLSAIVGEGATGALAPHFQK